MLMQSCAHAQECRLNDAVEEQIVVALRFINACILWSGKCHTLSNKIIHASCVTLLQYGDVSVHILVEALDVVCSISEVKSCPTIIECGYAPLIVKYTTHSNVNVRDKALLSLVTLTRGLDDVTTTIVRSSLFNHVTHLLLTDEQTISHVVGMLSNVAAGSVSMITSLFDHHLLPIIASLLQSPCRQVVRDSVWVVTHFMSFASDEQKLDVIGHDKYGVLSAAIPLLAPELRRENPERNMVELLFEVYKELLWFITEPDDEYDDAPLRRRHLSDAAVSMLRSEMNKNVFKRRIEGDDYYHETQDVLSLLERLD